MRNVRKRVAQMSDLPSTFEGFSWERIAGIYASMIAEIGDALDAGHIKKAQEIEHEAYHLTELLILTSKATRNG